ncbi:uncharacterized protein [Amphiura filiformis]|uniref:uncharacterized protein n=1 Tax=Amphiura filiformis TaxID=82378 RepID=UPI003B223A56
MDDFKFNAAKMIAAQNKKTRPISPESESNWDSSEGENTAPHISSDEGEQTSIISNKNKGKTKNSTKGNNNNTVAKPVTNSSNQHLKPSNLLNGERTPVKNSPAASIRSGASKKGNVTVFVDNHGFDSDEDDDPVSVASKVSKKSLRKDDRPPYDFRNALQGTPQPGPDASNQQRPGKSRKGNTYDPKPKKPESTEEKDSDWDDSEEERETLQAIRQEMEKHSKKGSETKEDLTSSPETKDNKNNNTNGKSKNWIVKPRGRSRNPKPPKSPSPNSPSPRSQRLTTTTSEIELRKIKAGMSASGNYDNLYENAEELIETENYGKDTQSSAHAGNFSPSMAVPSLPTSGFNNIRDNRYVYLYDHGSTAYYDTRYGRQEIYMTRIADKSEHMVRKCSLEFFAALRIVADFFIILILEFLRFITYHLISVLLVGLLTTLGDYLIKPVLAAFFNTILQPFAVFLYNIGVAYRTVMMPLIDVMRSVFTQLAMLLRAFRLVELNWRTSAENSNQRSIHDV